MAEPRPSRRTVLTGMAGLAGAVGLGLGAGCSWSAGPTSAGSSTLLYAIDAEPAAGGIDPFLASNLPSRRVMSLVYDSLLSRTASGEIVPEIAESFDHIDHQEFTFRLRPGVKFADGTPLTGDDVAYTLQAIADGTNEAKIYLGSLNEVRASKSVVTVRLDHPNPAFLNFVADPKTFFVVNAKAYDAASDGERQRNSFGTAAYTLGAWSDGNYLTLDRNQHYWQPDRPRTDRISMQVVPDETTRLALVQQRTVDMAWFADAQLAVEAAALGYRKADPVPTQGMYVFINPTAGPLSDKRVRQAVSCALDRQQLVDVAMQGNGVVSFPSPPGSPGVAGPGPDTPFHQRDPVLARRLLSEAGQPTPTIRMSYFSDSVTNQHPVYALMQQQLAEAGIRLVLEPTPLAALSPVFTAGASFDDLAAIPWSFKPDPAFYFTPFLGESGALNHWKEDPDADRARQLLDDVLVTTDPANRSELFDELNREVAENVLMLVPMCVPERVEVWQENTVRGYEADALVTRRNLKELVVHRG